jgi:hypothetical protein
VKDDIDLISREEVQQIFRKKIVPRLNQLYSEREAIVKKLGFAFAVTTAFLLTLLYFKVNVPIIVIIALYSGEYYYFTHKFVKKFKAEVVSDVFNALMPGCEYNPEGQIQREDFAYSNFSSGVFSSCIGEDYVRGTIGNTFVEFSELNVSKKISKKSDKIIFEGLFFKFHLNKNLQQSTLILADYSENILGKEIGRFIQKHTSREGYELVQVESLEFEKLFAVYSNDQVQSRVVLSPRVLQNLVNFKKKYKHIIDLSIRNGYLFVALYSSKNHFEPNLFGEIISLKEINEIYDLVSLVIDLQEDLDISEAA